MDKIQERIEEQDKELHEILDNAVYDCDIDEQGHKVKRCSRCMCYAGRTTTGEGICIKEL